MAALRYGVKTVIIPKANEKDLQEIDQTVRRALNFIVVDHVDAVIDAALALPTGPKKAEKQKKQTLSIPQEQNGTKAGLRQ